MKYDNVNKPKHYNQHPSGVECIQITEWMGYNLGNAMKYIWRQEEKGGIKDLEKAIWYINREIAKISKTGEATGASLTKEKPYWDTNVTRSEDIKEDNITRSWE